MSLKARLRIAIVVLTTAVVVLLSLLYVHSFLANELDTAMETAKSITDQVQQSVIAILTARSAVRNPPPANEAELKKLWLEVVEKDPATMRMLDRALASWNILGQLYIVDANGRVLATSNSARSKPHAVAVTNFEQWRDRSLLANVRQVFINGEDTEWVQPLALQGDKQALMSLHVVVSSPVLRESMRAPFKWLLWAFALALLASLILSVILPDIVVNPLERLAQQLDRMAVGEFQPPQPGRREAKEFAEVYSKLNLLGQQVQGARENADDLRTNVEQLLERMDQTVLLVDPAGRLMTAGRNAGSLLGSAPEALQGRMFVDLFPPSSPARLVAASLLDQRKAVADETLLFETASGPRSLTMSVEPLLRGPEQRPMGSLVMLRDKDTRVQIEADLDLAGRVSALSRLTRGVAHEIKNPLNAISIHLSILRARIEGPAPEVDIIASEIQRLDRVVKDFLEFNKPFEPKMTTLDLGDLAADLCRLVEPQARDHNIEVDVDTRAEAVIEGDRDLLKQAVLNVLMNAIEVMPEGGKLSVATIAVGRYRTLSIRDTGPGIPDKLQDRIFNLYFTTKAKGSGIGLAMAFRLVQLHNGKLEFSSQPGEGTTFRFSFPEAISRPLVISRTHTA